VSFGGKHKNRDSEIIEIADFIGVKSYKARGKRLSNYEVKVVKELEPLIKEDEVKPKQSSVDEQDDTSQMSLFQNGKD